MPRRFHCHQNSIVTTAGCGKSVQESRAGPGRYCSAPVGVWSPVVSRCSGVGSNLCTIQLVVGGGVPCTRKTLSFYPPANKTRKSFLAAHLGVSFVEDTPFLAVGRNQKVENRCSMFFGPMPKTVALLLFSRCSCFFACVSNDS